MLSSIILCVCVRVCVCVCVCVVSYIQPHPPVSSCQDDAVIVHLDGAQHGDVSIAEKTGKLVTNVHWCVRHD